MSRRRLGLAGFEEVSVGGFASPVGRAQAVPRPRPSPFSSNGNLGLRGTTLSALGVPISHPAFRRQSGLFGLGSLSGGNGADRLLTGESLTDGQVLLSNSGVFRLQFGRSNDGNLILNQRDVAVDSIWSSNKSDGSGPHRLTMQDDANLVVYNGQNRSIWSTDTWRVRPKSSPKLILQDDGNLILDNGGRAIWSQGWSNAKRNWEDGANFIRNSGLFDPAYYANKYPDLKAAFGSDAAKLAMHYLRDGAREGRDPHPAFSTSGYLQAWPDVVAAGNNPLIHFLKWGQPAGRTAVPTADDPRVIAARQGAAQQQERDQAAMAEQQRAIQAQVAARDAETAKLVAAQQAAFVEATAKQQAQVEKNQRDAQAQVDKNAADAQAAVKAQNEASQRAIDAANKRVAEANAVIDAANAAANKAAQDAEAKAAAVQQAAAQRQSAIAAASAAAQAAADAAAADQAAATTVSQQQAAAMRLQAAKQQMAAADAAASRVEQDMQAQIAQAQSDSSRRIAAAQQQAGEAQAVQQKFSQRASSLSMASGGFAPSGDIVQGVTALPFAAPSVAPATAAAGGLPSWAIYAGIGVVGLGVIAMLRGRHPAATYPQPYPQY